MTDRRPTLRVCHLIHDLGPGGAEHVLVDLASIAPSVGIEVTVVSMLPTTGLRYPELLRANGVAVHSLGLRAWWDPRGPARLRSLMDHLAPAVLHSHLKHADVIAGRVSADIGIPHVSTLHVIEDSVGLLGRWKRDLAMRSRMRTATLTIAVSEAQRSWYLQASGEDPERVVVIPNGIPDPGIPTAEARSRARAEFGLGEDEVVAAMIAVVRPGKGHDVLFAALARMADPPVVIVVGDGEAMPAVRLGAAALGDRVRLLGFREDVSHVLAAADLVVHPTLADALPTALVHAIAAGLPVVASEVGGVPEVVPVGAGELVPPGDPSALAAALTRMVSSAEIRHRSGARGRAHFEEHFRADHWVAALRDRYEALVAVRS